MYRIELAQDRDWWVSDSINVRELNKFATSGVIVEPVQNTRLWFQLYFFNMARDAEIYFSALRVE
jgi:hypothetical protein